MSTEEEVRAAKIAFQHQLGRQPWLRGIGIGKDADGYYIKVNTGEPQKLASSFNGVRIITEVVGDIRAFDRSRVRG